MNGRELATDLAKHLHDGRPGGRMVWEEIGVGPMWGYWDAGRVDVLTMETSYTRPVVRIYEVKASRGDFWADVNQQKYQKYLGHCSQFYFACPASMLKTDEVPAGCGLIVKGDRSWTVVKGAKARKHELTLQFVMGLLMHGFTEWTERWKQLERHDLLQFKDFKTLSRQFAITVVDEIDRAQGFLQEVERAKAMIEQCLGREFDHWSSAFYALQNEVERLQSQYRYGSAALQLYDICRRLLEGTYFWAHGTADQLRRIADEIEKEDKAAKAATGADMTPDRVGSADVQVPALRCLLGG